jgi:CDP-glucose 4,6-dehydratase
MGTVNLLEVLRGVAGVQAILVVTSDKAYENKDDGRAYTEGDRLGGSDPYSASKVACELATASYRDCFFAPQGVPLGTARAGNVVGGGDWSEDRLVPDLWRALRASRPVELRYPQSTRPWQHVLEPLAGYLLYLERLAQAPAGSIPMALNFGPIDRPSMTVAAVADRFWAASGAKGAWVQALGEHPPEKALLAIDARQARAALGWRPRLDADETLEWTASWYAAYDAGADMLDYTLRQIGTYQDRLS